MLSVGFDGRTLVSPAAGVRRYAFELFGAMAALRRVRVVAVGTPAGVPLPEGVERGPTARSLPTNPGWMLTGLPRAANRAQVDLFHAPSYTAPANGPRPLVLTIHDVSYERHPEWYPHQRGPVRRAFYRWSARTADRVITDSEFSRSEILAAYALDAARVHVVPLAASDRFRGMSAAALPHGVSTPYVLHVGDLHPRRNLEVAVNAVLQVRAGHADLGTLQLVLAGVDRGTGSTLVQAGAQPGRESCVRLLGSTEDGVLGTLYASAAALVYPSRYEGFGLPLLEAMASGTPVIASKAAAIPEVTGDAAILVEPGDTAGWAHALESVLHDPAAAARCREAGRQRAARFSWRRTAEGTLDVYERALARRK